MISTSRSAASVRSAFQKVSSRTVGLGRAWPAGSHSIPESRNRPAPPRNRWSVTPSAFIASVSSVIRCWPRPSSRSAARCARSGTSTSPSSPRVQVTSVTPRPSATYFAIVAPLLIDSSSGWAWTSSSRWSCGRVTGPLYERPSSVLPDPTPGGAGQVDGRARGDRGVGDVVPSLVPLDEQLEDDLRRVAQHRPRVVLVVVLPGQRLPDDRCGEAVGGQPRGRCQRGLLLEEDRASRSGVGHAS